MTIFQPDYSVLLNYEETETLCDGKIRIFSNFSQYFTSEISFLFHEKTQFPRSATLKYRVHIWFTFSIIFHNVKKFLLLGLDNDCDGLPDDNLIGPPLTNSTGVCAGYSKTCIDGDWVDDYSIVNNFQMPEGDKCDGLDNDCDGIGKKDSILLRNFKVHSGIQLFPQFSN